MFLIVSRYLIPRGYRGMTVYPFVILREKEDAFDRILVNHEKIHIRQQIELLIIPFYVLYMADYLLKLYRFKDRSLAYRNIIFEREAYQNEKDLDYLKKRPFWNFKNYL
ncbi:MAG TPA: hypothetical protein VF581_00245 [Flavobacterium sp.]|jgi:hypothetical protein